MKRTSRWLFAALATTVLVAVTNPILVTHPQSGAQAAVPSSLDALKLQADALAASIKALQNQNVGAAADKRQLASLANVVRQLQENIVIALPQADPGEVQFLNDEYASINGQYTKLAARIGGGGDPSDPVGKSDTAVTVLASTAQAGYTYTITPAANDRTFDGIGGIADSSQLLYFYPEPQRSQILDYLFKPNYGLAAQILKLEIGGDMNNTVGSESSHQHSRDGVVNVKNGYETWLAQEALKRNPDILIWGLQWGAPGWLRSICSQDDADYLVKWVKGLNALNVRVDYLSAGQNEANCVANAGTGSLSDTDTIKTLRNTLNAAGLQQVKVIGYDGTTQPNPTSLDAQTASALYGYGWHYPGGWQAPLTWRSTVDTSYQGWESRGIKFWASEDTDFQSILPPGRLTPQYNFRYIQNGTTQIIAWTLLGATYSTYDFLRDTKASPNAISYSNPQMPIYATEPWSGNYELVEAPFWAMAHTTQFTKPGWRYAQSAVGKFNTGGSTQGSIVTYRSGETGPQNWTSTIETVGATADQIVKIIPGNGLANTSLSIFTSNDTSKTYFNKLGTFKVPANGLTLQVKPNSIVTVSTLSGQGKGQAHLSAPPSKNFPTLHSDNFESYQAAETNILYTAPQNGAYEVKACKGGRSGKCIEQVAPQLPIKWPNAQDHDPFVLVGDQGSIDGSVTADVLLPDTNASTYAGIGGHNQYYRAIAQSYKLLIYGNGAWRLVRTGTGGNTGLTTLASGTNSADATPAWHTLKLSFAGGRTNPTISASIDGSVVANAIAAPDKSIFVFGQPSLLSNYTAAQYDNLVLESLTTQPLTSKPPVDGDCGGHLVPYTTTGVGFCQWSFLGPWGSGGGNTWSDNATGGATIKFKGASEISYTALTNRSNGIASVRLDGGSLELIDLYNDSANGVSKVVYTKTGINPNVEHTLAIAPTGTKNSAATGTFVSIVNVEFID